MPRLTAEEMNLIAQALRYLSNIKITDSLSARGEAAQQELRRRAEAAGELALRVERAQVERARAARKPLARDIIPDR